MRIAIAKRRLETAFSGYGYCGLAPITSGRGKFSAFSRKGDKMAKYPDITVGQMEACVNRLGGMVNFLRFIGGHGRIVFDPILTLIRTVHSAAQPAVTTSEEYFKEAGVVVMGNDFKFEFLDLEVPATKGIELAVHKLEKPSFDIVILTELGCKAEISISQFHAFLATNRGSPEYFIFHLKGKWGAPWAVVASWWDQDGGWHVSIHRMSIPETWSDRLLVVSQG